MRRTESLLGASLVLLVIASACGRSGSDLPPAAADGRDLYLSAGCAACHGVQGQGGVGPVLTGLLGSTVELEDGSTVVADEAYLLESILTPDARRVAGFDLRMPANGLSASEADRVVAYLETLDATP